MKKNIIAFGILLAVAILVIFLARMTEPQRQPPPSAAPTKLTVVRQVLASPTPSEWSQVEPDQETGRFIDYGDPYLGDRVMTPTPPAGYEWGEPLPGWISIDGVVFENWDCFGLRRVAFVNCDYNLMRLADVNTWDSSQEILPIYTPTPTAIPPSETIEIMFYIKVTGKYVNPGSGLNVRKCGASLYNACTAFFILSHCDFQPDLSTCTNELVPVYEIKYKEFSHAHPADTGWWANVVCSWRDPNCNGNYWIPLCLEDGRCFTNWRP